MFLVQTTSPLDEHWEERDEKLKTLAARKWNCYETSIKGGCIRYWYVATIYEAQMMMKQLKIVEGVDVSIRER